MSKYAIIALLLLTGCSTHLYGGAALHSPRLDTPEHNIPNPIGVVRLEFTHSEQCTPSRWSAYAEHQSSIPLYEKGYGYNTMGILRRLK